MRVLSVTSLPLHPALVWAHPHKFGRFGLVRLGDSIEHNPTRQNNSVAWLVRLIRVYFLLFPVSLCALTVATELRQVRHCAICRLLCPLLCECGPLLIQCGPLLGRCGIQSGFRMNFAPCAGYQPARGVVWCGVLLHWCTDKYHGHRRSADTCRKVFQGVADYATGGGGSEFLQFPHSNAVFIG